MTINKIRIVETLKKYLLHIIIIILLIPTASRVYNQYIDYMEQKTIAEIEELENKIEEYSNEREKENKAITEKRRKEKEKARQQIEQKEKKLNRKKIDEVDASNQYNLSTERIMQLGRAREDIKKARNACSQYGTRNPARCLASMMSAGIAETTACKNQTDNNCFGLMKNGKPRKYASIQENMNDRAKRFNRYRYKHTNADGYLKKSKYCTSEHSSNSQNDCPNWRKHFTKSINFLSSK